MADESAGWVVARTKPCHENYAFKNVARQGYDVYLPRCEDARSGRVSALFPGYLFVAVAERWTWLRNTYGILDVVFSTGGQPARVSKDIVDEIKAREGSDGYVALPEQPKFKPGESVRVNHGSINCLGLFVGMDGLERICVLMNILGAQRHISVPEQCVEVA